MHFTALSLMSSIALLIMAGSICATSLMMLACSSLRVAGRGLENGRRWKSMSSLWPEELFIFMEGHSKVITQFERVQRVDNKVLAHTIKTVFYIHTSRFIASQGFVKKSIWISHQPELYLSQLISTKLTFF